jgi:anti-sigma factor RsiW
LDVGAEFVMTTNWTCELTEARLSDYLDGLLQPSQQAAFDTHVNGCERCTPLVMGVSRMVTNLHAMEQVEAPPRLITGILDQTLGPRESAESWWRQTVRGLKRLTSPKFAYGAVSVAATFMLIATATGFSWRKPKLADLAPANIIHNANGEVHRAYARSTKFASDLRVVYEIQARFSQGGDIPANQENVLPQPAPQKDPGRTDASPATPRQQNRATGIERHLEMMAAEFPCAMVRRVL